MGENTAIEWATHTFNPWLSCQKVSPGCDNCYAESWAKRSGLVEWGPHAQRRRTSVANWKKPHGWARQAKVDGIRPRVFCASLSDWLDNQAPQEWRMDLAGLIMCTPELDWLLLTKRIENFRKLSPFGAEIPDNVWIGATCEDQERYDQRWPILNDIPASVRFISYEPAIGPLIPNFAFTPDWIICGGESGHHAREMNPEWARRLRDRCAVDGIAFFFKQMTRKAPIPSDLMVRQFPCARLRSVEK